MLNRLLSRVGVVREGSFMIGDKPLDMEAAAAANIEGVLFDGFDLMDTVERQLGRRSARP